MNETPNSDVRGVAPRSRGDAPSDQIGLRCPTCWCKHFMTVDTRPAPGNGVRRRRECRNCGRRVTTLEKSL